MRSRRQAVCLQIDLDRGEWARTRCGEMYAKRITTKTDEVTCCVCLTLMEEDAQQERQRKLESQGTV